MDFASIMPVAQAFGVPGLVIGFLIWDRDRRDKNWRDHEEKRLKQEEARINCDKDMVAALTALKVTIEARANAR